MEKRILIVDDDEETRDLLSLLLSQAGYKISTAENSADFAQKAFDFCPHLIILDIMLGQDHGVHCYNHLVQQGLDRNIPVIFLSGLVENHSISPASEGHNYALRAKPFKLDDIMNDIRCLLHSGGS